MRLRRLYSPCYQSFFLKLIFLTFAVFVSIFSEAASAEVWTIRSGPEGVRRTDEGKLIFGNGVQISFYQDRTEVTLPNLDRIILYRHSNASPSRIFIPHAATTSTESAQTIKPDQSRNFGAVTLNPLSLVINQQSPGQHNDLISFVWGVLFAYSNSTTVAVVDLHQPNRHQPINNLPDQIRETIRQNLKLHNYDLPANAITNVYTTAQLRSIWENRVAALSTSRLIAKNRTSQLPQSPFFDPGDVRASWSPKINPLLSPPSSTDTPGCCCPNSTDGNTSKKKKVIYSPGTLQGDSKEPHHSFDRLKNHFDGSPCVDIEYNPWSAWDCLDESARNLAKQMSNAINSGDYCSVDSVGYSGGGTLAAEAARRIERHNGVTAPVHVTTLGAPFSASPGYTELILFLTIVPPAGLPVVEAFGGSPCGARQIAEGWGVESPTDPLTTMNLYYSSGDTWVSPQTATTGGPSRKPGKIEYRDVVTKDHDQIIDSVIDAFDWGGGCCANGKLEDGEECDNKGGFCKDSNGRKALCTASCKCPILCGNGVRDVTAYPGGNTSLPMVRVGEECDPPNSPSVECKGPTRWDLGHCDNDCRCIPPGCGDGKLDKLAGEECEPSDKEEICICNWNGMHDVKCTKSCKIPECDHPADPTPTPSQTPTPTPSPSPSASPSPTPSPADASGSSKNEEDYRRQHLQLDFEKQDNGEHTEHTPPDRRDDFD